MAASSDRQHSAVRPARSEDVPALVDLLRELFTIEADFEPDGERQRAGLIALLAAPNARIWVAERAGRVVGLVTLQTAVSTAEGGAVGWIEDLIVTESARGLGLGRTLLDAVERWAREQGLLRLQLLADRQNRPALEFYAKADWQTTQLVALRKVLARRPIADPTASDRTD